MSPSLSSRESKALKGRGKKTHEDSDGDEDRVDITVVSLDDHEFYLGMDFLDTVKAFIVSYVSTLSITADGQAHSIPMRQEGKNESMLPALQFSKVREPSYLASLKKDEGLTCVTPTSP